MVKKIAVFGGTGMTGQSVIEYALSQGKATKKKIMKLINKISFVVNYLLCVICYRFVANRIQQRQEKR